MSYRLNLQVLASILFLGVTSLVFPYYVKYDRYFDILIEIKNGINLIQSSKKSPTPTET